ncbi:MAG: GntR family transcriptional regulator [Planctomycetota bacterium]|jgi:DNA-binding LacI/PurR family transcriptional regulator
MKKFEKIFHHLHQQIQTEELHPGDRIPTERELCKEFGVSRITAMRAVKELESMGIITRTAGRGSFVTARPAREDTGFHLLLPRLDTPYYSTMSDAFCQHLNAAGTMGTVMLDWYDPNITRELIIRLQQRGTRGLAIVPSGNPDLMEGTRRLLKGAGFPIAIGSRELIDFEGPQVIVDEVDAGLEGVKYLHSLGHTRIAYAGSTAGYTSSQLRYEGFQAALSSLALTREECPHLPNTDPLALPFLKQIFQGPTPPTAVLCADEPRAVQLYDLLITLGVRVPEDAAILSLDGGMIGASTVVPLSTIDFPGRTIGAELAKTLISLETPEPRAGVLRLKSTVTPRQSCGASPNRYRHEFLRELIQTSEHFGGV